MSISKNNDMYYHTDMDYDGLIYKIDVVTGNKNVFFSFGKSTLIDEIKFDNNNNLIIIGNTTLENIATNGAYIEDRRKSPKVFGNAHPFIAKINEMGRIIWCTYFHELLINKNNLTIDSKNNIYILNKRYKNESLTTSTFQNIADLNSSYSKQDAITKLTPDGDHIWSTFYFSEDSELESIVSGSDGFYMYGVYYGNNVTNNFFSTKNSYQEYPIVIPNKNSFTTFLSKFDFNGKRIWSTYFGNDLTSNVNNNYYVHSQSLITIDNDPYILTSNISRSSVPKNIATPNSFMDYPPEDVENMTLSRFSTTGSRIWTTYLTYGSKGIQKTAGNNILVISRTYDGENYSTTNDAFQKYNGVNDDIHTLVLNKDGKEVTHGSYYGYDGYENGTAYTTTEGFYLFGLTMLNNSPYYLFSTSNQLLTSIDNIQGKYRGIYMAYFKRNNLLLENEDIDKILIYPNPTNDKINIILNDNDINNSANSFEIYDINGRLVFKRNLIYKTIDVSMLSSGTYILKTKIKGNINTFKFIKI